MPTMDLKLELFDGTGQQDRRDRRRRRRRRRDDPQRAARRRRASTTSRCARCGSQGQPGDRERDQLVHARPRAGSRSAPNEESEPDDVAGAGAAARARRADARLPRARGRRRLLLSARRGRRTLAGFLSGIDGVDVRVVVLPRRLDGGAAGRPCRRARACSTRAGRARPRRFRRRRRGPRARPGRSWSSSARRRRPRARGERAGQRWSGSTSPTRSRVRLE